jgi:hypothetical protein
VEIAVDRSEAIMVVPLARGFARDAEVDWFVLEGGRYERLPSSAPGTLRGRAFPGLWLDVPALLRGDAAALIEGLDAGLASDEHARFVAPAGPRE